MIPLTLVTRVLAGALVVAWLGSFPAPGLAATRQPARSKPAVRVAAAPRPVYMDELAIRARSTEFDGERHVYRVLGDVHVEIRDLKVDCHEALIHLSVDDERVDHIVFIGDVVAVRGRSTFRGDRVTYAVATKKLVAEGNTRTKVVLPATSSATRR